MNGALDYKIWEPYKSLLPIPDEKETRWHPSCYKGKPVVIIK